MSGLKQFQTEYSGLISSVRGRGTFCAVNLPSAGMRDQFLTSLRQNGVHLGGCGDETVRFRPSLTFTPNHADIMLETMEKVLKKF